MELKLDKNYMRRMLRAVVEFDLIQPEDRIMVGFSGGKDSAFLVYAMAVLKKALPFPIEVKVVSIDLGFNEDFPVDKLKGFCQKLGLEHHTIETNIKEKVLAKDPDNPCASCTFFRKGAINNFAVEQGFKKVALGHHYDDAVVTFLMSIIYSAQIKTFQPKQYLSRKDITIIRPLVYLKEKSIAEWIKKSGYTPVTKSCPYEGETSRFKIKKIVNELTRENKKVFYNLASAMRLGVNIELWPKEPEKKEIFEKQKLFWYGEKNKN